MDQDSYQSSFAKEHRLRAQRSGFPLPRCEHPTIINDDERVIAIWYSSGKLTAVDILSGETEKIAPGWFEHTFASKLGRPRIVYADSRTRNRLITNLERRSDIGASHARMLNALSHLPLSITFTDLTAALRRRWWLPADMDDRSISAWKEAFEIEAKGIDGFVEMLSKVNTTLEGEPFDPIENKAIVTLHRKLISAERQLYDSARYSGVRSAMRRHTLAEHIQVIDSTLRNIDPRMTHESMVSGETVAMTITETGSDLARGSLTEPCKLRQGRSVLVLDGSTGRGLGSAVLSRLSLDGGSLVGEFVPSKSPTEFPFGPQVGSLYVIVPEPYLGGAFAPGRIGKRWIDEKVPKVSGRRVPIDVAVAGNSDTATHG